MKRRVARANYPRFGWSAPHSLNVRVGYRGGVRK
ncbi:hypothetical protein [Dipodfec virus UOA04_Rod_618]|nr:hypothetical protein [Dipodfec virus UOA04_Rod_618]